MDVVPIVAIVCGNAMIIAVAAIVAVGVTKAKKYKQILSHKERETLEKMAKVVSSTNARSEMLEERLNEQERVIQQLKEDSSFLRRLIEDKS